MIYNASSCIFLYYYCPLDGYITSLNGKDRDKNGIFGNGEVDQNKLLKMDLYYGQYLT